MKVLICGSRNWPDGRAIAEYVKTLSGDALVIHGGADGADAYAENCAAARGLHTAIVRPRWRIAGEYHANAGHVRNAVMLDLDPDFVVAFQRNGSKGTQGTIDEARRRGIPVEVHTP